MKKLYTILLFLGFLVNGISQTLILKVEAEQSNFSNLVLSKSFGGYSGSGYLTGFSDTSAFSFSINAPRNGNYELRINHINSLRNHTKHILVDGIIQNTVSFPVTPSGFSLYNAGRIWLTQGTHTIGVSQASGGGNIDYVAIYDVPPHDYSKVVASLIDEQAHDYTKEAYAFLRDRYGKTIITGQTSKGSHQTTSYWNQLVELTGKTPKLRAWDLQNYSPMNPWGYKDGQPAFVAFEDGTIQEVIDWYNATKDQCSLVSLQWHWFSPTSGVLQQSSFYQDWTTFDIREAVKEGTPEYAATIRDIDSIASQLKRLEAENIPILWRPLHEAHGNWFWWGSKGVAPVLTLWDIMYNRLTNHHQLHNLIWVWSAEEEAYYPGNDKVDVFGFDSYPGAYNYTSQRAMFDQMYDICKGEKLIAMTENGPLPDITDCYNYDAIWSYFSTWRELLFEQNSDNHIHSTYHHRGVLTQNDGCSVIGLGDDVKNVVSFVCPNPTHGILHIDIAETWTIYNAYGQSMQTGKESEIDVSTFESGMYVIKTAHFTQTIVKY